MVAAACSHTSCAHATSMHQVQVSMQPCNLRRQDTMGITQVSRHVLESNNQSFASFFFFESAKANKKWNSLKISYNAWIKDSYFKTWCMKALSAASGGAWRHFFHRCVFIWHLWTPDALCAETARHQWAHYGWETKEPFCSNREEPTWGGRKVKWLSRRPCGGGKDARRRTEAPTHKPSSESRDLRLVTARTKLGLSAPSRTKAPWWSLKGSWGDHLKTSRLKGTFKQNIY